MNSFQFDQCLNDSSLIRRCNEEGLVIALSLPAEWHGLKDPELLAEVRTSGHPLMFITRLSPEQVPRVGGKN